MQKLIAVIFLKDFFIIAIYLLRLLYPYRPFLDDYIQYNVYSLHPEPIKNVFINAGTFTTRPAANFLDIVLYSSFGDILYIPYAFLVLLYLAFVLLLRRVLSEISIDTGRNFMIIALLCPLNIEGTVWVSAASRITVGLFLGTVSALLIENKMSPGRLILFWLTNLVSYLFYEQAAVFNFLLIFLISYCRRYWSAFFAALINGIGVAAFYFAFRNYGVFSHRMSSLGVADAVYFLNRLTECLRSCFFTLMPSGMTFIAGIIVSLISAKSFYRGVFSSKKILFGIGVVLCSFVPVTLLGEYNIPFRCLTVSLMGAALIIDSINSPGLSRILSVILTAVFLSASFNEFYRLDSSCANDARIVSAVSDIVSENQEKAIAIHGAKAYYEDKPSNHAEHIAAITSSDWAITGALRARLKNPYLPLIKLDEDSDVNIYMSDDGTEIAYCRLNSD